MGAGQLSMQKTVVFLLLILCLFLAAVAVMLEPPLIRASRKGDIEKVQALISMGVNLNRKDWRGRTALHIAAQYGNSRVMEELLNVGADIDTVSDDGFSALEYAILEGNVEAVRVLTENEANVELIDVELSDNSQNDEIRSLILDALGEKVKKMSQWSSPESPLTEDDHMD